VCSPAIGHCDMPWGRSVPSAASAVARVAKAAPEDMSQQSPQLRQQLKGLDDRLNRAEALLGSGHDEVVDPVFKQLEDMQGLLQEEHCQRGHFEETVSRKLRVLESRLDEAPIVFEKTMLDYVARFEQSSANAVSVIDAHNRDNQKTIGEVKKCLSETSCRLQSVEDFCAVIDRKSASAGTGMPDSCRFSYEGSADYSLMSVERQQLEEKLAQEIEKLARQQEEVAASLKKHMEATIDTNHQASALVLDQLNQLARRVDEELGLEVQRLARMQHDYAQQQRHIEASQHGNSAPEANMRFSGLEARCTTIEERLLQNDLLVEEVQIIKEVCHSLELLRSASTESSSGGGQDQGAMSNNIAERIQELEKWQKMVQHERDERDASLKHVLASVIADNLQAVKDLEDKVNKRFDSEVSARSNLEQQIVALLAAKVQRLTSQTEHVVGKLANAAASQEQTPPVAVPSLSGVPMPSGQASPAIDAPPLSAVSPNDTGSNGSGSFSSAVMRQPSASRTGALSCGKSSDYNNGPPSPPRPHQRSMAPTSPQRPQLGSFVAPISSPNMADASPSSQRPQHGVHSPAMNTSMADSTSSLPRPQPVFQSHPVALSASQTDGASALPPRPQPVVHPSMKQSHSWNLLTRKSTVPAAMHPASPGLYKAHR